MNATVNRLRRLAAVFGVALCWLPAQAQHDDGALALSVTQDTAAVNSVAQSTQSMLWARRQAVSVGFGVEQRTRHGAEMPALTSRPLAGAALQTQALLVGVSVATTPRTSISLQAPVWTDARERERSDAQVPRMTLRSRDALGDLRAGLQMKMKLQEQTTLSVRPRRRGVGVTLHSQW